MSFEVHNLQRHSCKLTHVGKAFQRYFTSNPWYSDDAQSTYGTRLSLHRRDLRRLLTVTASTLHLRVHESRNLLGIESNLHARSIVDQANESEL